MQRKQPAGTSHELTAAHERQKRLVSHCQCTLGSYGVWVCLSNALYERIVILDSWIIKNCKIKSFYECYLVIGQ